MARPLALVLVSLVLPLLFASCRTANGLDSNGDSLLFKTYGQFNSAIGRMELVKGLGLPYSVQNNLATIDFSKPIIFLPKDIASVSLRETYRVGASTITIISAPTQACQYSYVVLTINPDKTYFGRRIQPCDHDLRFSGDGQGVTIVEQNVADPRWWWMSNTRFAGPILQSALVATRKPAQPVPPSTDENVAANSPGGENSSTQNEPKSDSAASSHAVPAKPRPAKPKPTQAVQANAPAPDTSGPPNAPTKRLQYVSTVAMNFSMTSHEERGTTHICLADGSTCGQ